MSHGLPGISGRRGSLQTRDFPEACPHEPKMLLLKSLGTE